MGKNIKIEIIPKINSNAKDIHDLSFGKYVKDTKSEFLFKSKTNFEILDNKSIGKNDYKILMKEL